MRNILIYLSIAIWLSGCATASKTYTSDGKVGYNITCSGNALNWGMCFEKAGELCAQQGYEVLERSDDKGFVVSGGYYGLMGGSVINRSMIVKCKQESRNTYTKNSTRQHEVKPERRMVQSFGAAKRVGIGIKVDNHGVINQIVDGSPGHSAGLKLGDKIIKIDRQSTINNNKTQIEEKLAGEVGTYANVSVLRNNKKVYLGLKREGYID